MDKRHLRGVMEMYHTSCRFLLTCNYPQRIIPALHSRCQGFHIEKLDVQEFTARLATICISEGVQIDLETLDTYVQASYPDLRKCINLVQQNVVDWCIAANHRTETVVHQIGCLMLLKCLNQVSIRMLEL